MRLRSASVPRLPPHAPGMRIGLFGGSFDPPHDGHVFVSRVALKRLRLDRLWWLVSPGNPLKARGLHSLDERMAAAQKLAAHPRMVVSGLEAEIGSRFTHDTLNFLRKRCPGVRFVWIMGADNLLQFHRWRHWEAIARLMPIAIVDRPGATWKAASARAAQRFAQARVDEAKAATLADRRAPAFIYLHGPRVALSSTALRSGAK